MKDGHKQFISLLEMRAEWVVKAVFNNGLTGDGVASENTGIDGPEEKRKTARETKPAELEAVEKRRPES